MIQRCQLSQFRLLGIVFGRLYMLWMAQDKSYHLSGYKVWYIRLLSYVPCIWLIYNQFQRIIIIFMGQTMQQWKLKSNRYSSVLQIDMKTLRIYQYFQSLVHFLWFHAVTSIITDIWISTRNTPNVTISFVAKFANIIVVSNVIPYGFFAKTIKLKYCLPPLWPPQV